MRSSADSRRPALSRKLRLTTAVGSTVALLSTAVLSGCGAAEHVTAGMRAANALDQLGERPTASMIASVDGTQRDARRFLRLTRGTEPSDRAVRLLSRAEVTLAVGSGGETPLREMSSSDAMDVASALNLGLTDVFAVKSVQDQLYVRVELAALARQTQMSGKRRAQAEKLTALANELPGSLRSAQDVLRGEWVRVDPQAFDDFAEAARHLARKQAPGAQDRNAQDRAGTVGEALAGNGKGAGLRQALATASRLNGQSQREFVGRVETLLREHARFSDNGERGGAEHVRVTLPGREAAADLSAALRPLGVDVEPSRMPEREVSADLAIRRGQLTEITLDAAQFTGAYDERPDGGGAHLPLKLEFGPGEAVPVRAPAGTHELRPEDLMAAFVYGALGSKGLGSGALGSDGF